MAFLRFTEQFRNNLSNCLSHPLYTDRVGVTLSKFMNSAAQRWFLPLAMCFLHHLCVLLVAMEFPWISHCSQLGHGLWALHKAASWELHTKKGFFNVALSYQHWQQQQPDWGFINLINYFFFFLLLSWQNVKEKESKVWKSWCLISTRYCSWGFSCFTLILPFLLVDITLGKLSLEVHIADLTGGSLVIPF